MSDVAKFTFFRSYWDALTEMKPADRHAVYDAMTAYAFEGTEPDLKSGPQKMAFTLMRPNIDKSIEDSMNGSKGGRPPKKKLRDDTADFEKPKGGLSKSGKGSSEESETDKEEDTDLGLGTGDGVGRGRRRKFTAPSLEEVRSYIQENSLNVDPEKWWHYYNARDWQFNNGQKMKNWKSAVQTWKKGGYDADSNNHSSGSLNGESRESPEGWDKIFG